MTTECSRCNQPKTKMVFIFRPAGHTFEQSNFDTVMPPSSENVCGNCLTDDEIVRELSTVVEFVLGVFIKNIQKESATPSRDAILDSGVILCWSR